MYVCSCSYIVFFFNDTATTEIYTLSLHDALPICFCILTSLVFFRRLERHFIPRLQARNDRHLRIAHRADLDLAGRSEEHTSELQSRQYLVCRLLLEKKKEINTTSLSACLRRFPFP